MITLPSLGFVSAVRFTTQNGTPYFAGAGYEGIVFTSSGTFTVLQGTATVEVLVIGGGGAGGPGGYNPYAELNIGGGGGAAGSYATGTRVLGPGSYTVTVGSGGTAGTNLTYPVPPHDFVYGNSGGNSSFSGTGIVTLTGFGGAGGEGLRYGVVAYYPSGGAGGSNIHFSGTFDSDFTDGGGGAGTGTAPSDSAGGLPATVLNYTFGYGGWGGTANSTSIEAVNSQGSGGGGGTTGVNTSTQNPKSGRAGAVVLRWSVDV